MRNLIRLFFRGVRLVLTPFVLAAHAMSRGKAIERPPQQQDLVQAAAANLTLYHFPTCPFCLKVRRKLHRLNINVALADAQHDATARELLKTSGGKLQVPALHIVIHPTETDHQSTATRTADWCESDVSAGLDPSATLTTDSNPNRQRHEIWLYESNAINHYLDARFDGTEAPRSHTEAWATLAQQ